MGDAYLDAGDKEGVAGFEHLPVAVPLAFGGIEGGFLEVLEEAGEAQVGAGVAVYGAYDEVLGGQLGSVVRIHGHNIARLEVGFYGGDG